MEKALTKSRQTKPKAADTTEQSLPAAAVKKRGRDTKVSSSAVAVPSKKCKNHPICQDATPCTLCKIKYCDVDNDKSGEAWFACDKCRNWYHSSCAEQCGILDDKYLTCRNCVD